MVRKIKIVPTVTDATLLNPMGFLEASLKNKGKAKFDANGNIVEASSGKPWIGGLPFADAKTANEAISNLTLSWGRHDYCQYAIRQWDIAPDRSEEHTSELQSLMRISYAVFCLKNKKPQTTSNLTRTR